MFHSKGRYIIFNCISQQGLVYNVYISFIIGVVFILHLMTHGICNLAFICNRGGYIILIPRIMGMGGYMVIIIHRQ